MAATAAASTSVAVDIDIDTWTGIDDEVMIDTKRSHEAKLQEYQDYLRRDSTTYPAETFLYGDIILNYGKCPFLDVYSSTPEAIGQDRKTWLNSYRDKGKKYVEIRDRILQRTRIEPLKNEVTDAVKALDQFVRTHVSNVDLIMEGIDKYKTSKSRNKHARDEWQLTLDLFEGCMRSTGVDFVVYVYHVHGITLRHKLIATNNGPENMQFQQLVKNIQDKQNDLKWEEAYIERQKAEAKNAIIEEVAIIRSNTRNGRHFKKWSALTDAQKKERIRAHCVYYVRSKTGCLSVSPVIVAKMQSFIFTNLDSKVLTPKTFHWNTKAGYIDSIDLNVSIDLAAETCDLKLADPLPPPPPRPVASSKPAKSVSINAPPSSSSSSSKKTANAHVVSVQDQLKDETKLRHINAVLFNFIRTVLPLGKTFVISQCAEALKSDSAELRQYLATTYDKMLSIAMTMQ